MHRLRRLRVDFPKAVYKRIGQALDTAPMTRQQVAARMGVDPARLSEWTSGRRTISGKALRLLCQITRTNAHWILFGTGPRDWP